MPAYELLMIIKQLERPSLVQTIKRGADLIIKRKGIIRSFENLGFKPLPYRMKATGSHHTTGTFMIIKFDAPREEVTILGQEIRKDQELIRSGIMPLTEFLPEFKTECRCEERGEFAKNEFNFEKPMTSWDKRRVYKNYGRRV